MYKLYTKICNAVMSGEMAALIRVCCGAAPNERGSITFG